MNPIDEIHARYLAGDDPFQIMFDLEDVGVSRPMAAMLMRMWKEDRDGQGEVPTVQQNDDVECNNMPEGSPETEQARSE